jgi:hypothetical protein
MRPLPPFLWLTATLFDFCIVAKDQGVTSSQRNGALAGQLPP